MICLQHITSCPYYCMCLLYRERYSEVYSKKLSLDLHTNFRNTNRSKFLKNTSQIQSNLLYCILKINTTFLQVLVQCKIKIMVKLLLRYLMKQIIKHILCVALFILLYLLHFQQYKLSCAKKHPPLLLLIWQSEPTVTHSLF